MKYKKGMRFLSLTTNIGCRTANKIYKIDENNDIEIHYIGDQNNSCTVKALKEILFLKDLNTEIDYLDAFQLNFKEGV